MKYKILFAILLIGISACKVKQVTQQNDIIKSYKPQKSLISEHTMVTSARTEASIIAKDILKKGGNAIDAAIATQMALAVCYPVAGNIGGGGFMVIRMNDGSSTTLDFREKAPILATKDMYLDDKGNAITEKSRTGHLAVGVPGSVAGMYEAYKKYSKLKDWKALIQPAINLATRGIFITKKQAYLLNKYHEIFKQTNSVSNEFTKKSKWENGDILKQQNLANTLIQIRDKGRDGFYKGEVANKIIAEMKRSNGIITHKDLAEYQAIWRKPIRTNYRGYDIISMPPPSSGGIALAQLLKMVEPYDMHSLGHHSPASIHLMIEAERRVYADRSKHLGDSDFYNVPIDTLLDKKYISSRMSDFNLEMATPSKEIHAGTINYYQNESTETTHYSIVDNYGNSIAVTTTINGHYGSKVVVGGAGFFLNNEMDDFSAKPGVPNMFGLIGAKANKIEPKKRMLSSMTPTIVEKDGKLVLSVGTPGGATIITSVFQTILNIIDHNMTAKQAIAAKRFHHQWKPNLIYIEQGAFAPETIKKLEKMGHKFKKRSSIGRVEAIMYNGSKLEGAADPRGDDDVRGD